MHLFWCYHLELLLPSLHLHSYLVCAWAQSLSHVRLFVTPQTVGCHGISQARILEWVAISYLETFQTFEIDHQRASVWDGRPGTWRVTSSQVRGHLGPVQALLLYSLLLIKETSFLKLETTCWMVIWIQFYRILAYSMLRSLSLCFILRLLHGLG